MTVINVSVPVLEVRGTQDTTQSSHQSSGGSVGYNPFTGAVSGEIHHQQGSSDSVSHKSAQLRAKQVVNFNNLTQLNLDGGQILTPQATGTLDQMRVISHPDTHHSTNTGGSIGYCGGLNLSANYNRENSQVVNQHSGLFLTGIEPPQVRIRELQVTDSDLNQGMVSLADKIEFIRLHNSQDKRGVSVSFSGLNLGSPEKFGESLGNSLLSSGAGVLASKIVRKMGGGDVLSSLAGTGASAYSSSILNQQNPDFANDNHERRAKSGGYAPSGFESMGEISFHRNGEETHIALVDLNISMLQGNLKTIEEVFGEEDLFSNVKGKSRAPEFEQAISDRNLNDEEKAFEDYKNLLRSIVETLHEEGADPAEIRAILKDESIKNLLRTSVGYQDPSDDQEIMRGRPLNIEITEGNIDAVDRALTLARKGAVAFSDFADKHPALVGLTLTTIQLALSGPMGLVREQLAQTVGLTQAVDEVSTEVERYFSQNLQERLGFNEPYADMTASGAKFGMMVFLGTLGGMGKDKIVQTAKEVKEKVKVYMTYIKPHPRGKVPYNGRTSGIVDDINDKNQLQKIIDKRDRNHHMSKEGFGRAKIDEVSINPNAIRGLEHKRVIDNGGPQSMGGTSSNKISPIAEKNPKKPIYEAARLEEFGE